MDADERGSKQELATVSITDSEDFTSDPHVSAFIRG